jgi:hypothetical protein
VNKQDVKITDVSVMIESIDVSQYESMVKPEVKPSTSKALQAENVKKKKNEEKNVPVKEAASSSGRTTRGRKADKENEKAESEASAELKPATEKRNTRKAAAKKAEEALKDVATKENKRPMRNKVVDKSEEKTTAKKDKEKEHPKLPNISVEVRRLKASELTTVNDEVEVKDDPRPTRKGRSAKASKKIVVQDQPKETQKVAEEPISDTKVAKGKSSKTKTIATTSEKIDKVEKAPEEKAVSQPVIVIERLKIPKATQKPEAVVVNPKADENQSQSRSRTKSDSKVSKKTENEKQKPEVNGSKKVQPKRNLRGVPQQIDEEPKEKSPEKAVSAKPIPHPTTSAAVLPSLSVSPTALKLIAMPKDIEEDPYSFDMSQSEVKKEGKKKPNPPKKRAAKAKPGNNIELLMKQKTMDAVENSCNVQHNPQAYEAERVNLEKRINQPTPAPPIVVVDMPRPKPVSPPFQTPAPIQKTGLATNVIHSKVWHSPQAQLTPSPPESENDLPTRTYVSNSPPIQSSFAIQMAAIAKKNHAKALEIVTATPFRVGGSLPSAFYVDFNKDGTPSYSSDLIEKENGRSLNSSACSSKASDKAQPEPSFLGDSNAENMEPPGCVKSPKKSKRNVGLVIRSPLKALPLPSLPAGDVSSISVLNTTFEQSIPAC